MVENPLIGLCVCSNLNCYLDIFTRTLLGGKTLSFKFRFLLLLNFSDLILLRSYFNLTKSLALCKRLKLGKALKSNNGLKSRLSLANDCKLGMKLLLIKLLSSCNSFFWFLLRSRLERRFSSFILSILSSCCFCSSSYWSAPPCKLMFLCVR